MKKYLTFIALATAYFCNAQQLPQSLTVAVNSSKVGQGIVKPVITPELSFYSKNYTEVFGRFNYNFDTQSIGTTKVYVGSNDKFYFNSGSIFITEMPIAGVTNLYNIFNYNSNDYLEGVLSLIAGKNIELGFGGKVK